MAENKTVKAADVIAIFKTALSEKWGYVWGQTHVKWDATRQAAYAKAKASNPDCKNSIKYGPKWYGHWVTDCSGLFSYAFSHLGGYMYHGSNTMYNKYCTSKGALKNGKRTDGKELKPGTAVFCYNETKKNRSHVGLYIGNGEVIEAKGAQYGVVKSKVTDSKWDDWGELKGCDYNVAPTPDPKPTPTPTPEKGYAIVTGTNLALRQGPSTSCAVITRAPTGSKVKIEKVPDDWEYVTYGNKKGFMMKQYLKEG